MRTIFKSLVLIAAMLETSISAYGEHKDHKSSLGFLSCEAERSTSFLMLDYIVIEPTTWERLKKIDEPETDEAEHNDVLSPETEVENKSKKTTKKRSRKRKQTVGVATILTPKKDNSQVSVGTRRSKRQRWKPLQYWKGERVVVAVDSKKGEIVTNAARAVNAVKTPMLKKYRNSCSNYA